MKRFLATMGIVGLTFLGATAPANATSEQITICHATGSETHPYEEITIDANAVSAHEDHQWGEDIIPAPAGGCPSGTTPPPGPETPPPADGKKVTICHATGSSTNPFVIITIDESALPAHRDHQEGEDIIPAPAAGCPAGMPPVEPPKVVPPVVPPAMPPVVPPAVPPAGAAAAPPAGAAAAAPAVTPPAVNRGFNAQTAVANEGVAGEAETGIPAWISGIALLLTAAGIVALRRREPAAANRPVAE
ncbi:hypothetical protein ACW0JT_24095 [Arthrobacter sp. SA17]